MDDLIAFLHARNQEATSAVDRLEILEDPGWLSAERDLAAKQPRLKFLESVIRGNYIEVGEHAQAEHLLKLEAAAYDWHRDYRNDEWLP